MPAPKKAAAKKAAAPKKAAVKKLAAKKAAAPKKAVAKAAPVVETPAPPVEREVAPGTITVSFEGPGPQRRVTVAFRVILAIPHLLYLYVLLLAGYVIAIIGWFGALFTGRLPTGIDTFLGRLVQHFARVYGYAWLLLTDQYPSFALDAPDYPISVDVTPTKLNRLAVLFRLLIMVPAAIVQWVLGAGLTVVAFIVWLIVLVTGRLPVSIFEAEAAALRFQVRFYSYAAMLTGEYPRGLFGDRAEDDARTAPFDPSATRPRITRLVLSKAAKRLVVVFIVVGALFGVGTLVASSIAASQTTGTYREVDGYHDDLIDAIDRFTVDAQACAAAGGLECVHGANSRLADAFATFSGQLESMRFPSYAVGSASDLRDTSDEIATFERRLASLMSAREYQDAARDYQRLLNRLYDDYGSLVDLLP